MAGMSPRAPGLNERIWDPVARRWSPRQVRREQNAQWLVWLSERFWAKAAITEPDACWWWQAKRTKNGYGVFSVAVPGSYKKGFCTTAQRVAWMLTHGSIPEGMSVDHLCLNPGCVNPAHMQLLPFSQNVREARWRQYGRRHG